MGRAQDTRRGLHSPDATTTTLENCGCCLRRYYHLAVWGMLSSDRLTRRLQGREWVRWDGLRHAAEPTLPRRDNDHSGRRWLLPGPLCPWCRGSVRERSGYNPALSFSTFSSTSPHCKSPAHNRIGEWPRRGLRGGGWLGGPCISDLGSSVQDLVPIKGANLTYDSFSS